MPMVAMAGKVKLRPGSRCSKRRETTNTAESRGEHSARRQRARCLRATPSLDPSSPQEGKVQRQTVHRERPARVNAQRRSKEPQSQIGAGRRRQRDRHRRGSKTNANAKTARPVRSCKRCATPFPPHPPHPPPPPPPPPPNCKNKQNAGTVSTPLARKMDYASSMVLKTLEVTRCFNCQYWIIEKPSNCTLEGTTLHEWFEIS